MTTRIVLLTAIAILFSTCKPTAVEPKASVPFTWDNATIYFMMTDRFNNGDESNDFTHPAEAEPAPYRGFMGGDLKGITAKIKAGYFDDLGVNAIWMTPVVEQIQGAVDEGTGLSYPFHGYWTRDWTALDSRFGTEADLKEMVATAHRHGIRILIDGVANHTGPVTEQSPLWPEEWVRTGPQCTYEGAESTISCTLVKNLPDIRTDSQEEVELPPFLVEKWKAEGRYDREVKELDEWFAATGYKRTAVNYILKWLVDFIKEYGIDGYRIDTVKHTEDYVWADLYKAAVAAYNTLKEEHPEMVIADNEFYMVGEVYNYYIGSGRDYDYTDKKVDFYKDGYHALINFDLKGSKEESYESLFARYDSLLHGPLAGKSVVNYMSSHDDGSPYDKERKDPFEAMTRLILTPGAVQMYYGDESARDLDVEADGDATLRSFMNWDELQAETVKNGYKVNDVLVHTQKLGKFRQNHPAVGAGRHKVVSASPYLFSRTWTQDDYTDQVLIGLNMPKGQMTIDVSTVFADGVEVQDAYSGVKTTVADGKVTIDSQYDIVLLEAV